MVTNAAAVQAALEAVATELDPTTTGIAGLRRLGGGASQQIWRFELQGPGTVLILRRTPGKRGGGFALGLMAEAEVMTRARAAGAPTPAVLHRFPPGGPLGEAYVMEHVTGETQPRRIFRDPAFAPARERAAEDLGHALARIHSTRTDGLAIRAMTPAGAVRALAERLTATGEARPVFELALRRLGASAPAPEPPSLVHGDFRLGNLMFAAGGLVAVLDWELAFLGDRHADFGWLAMESWRFGQRAPVAGLCSRAALIAAYQAAGGAPVDRTRMDWWELWSALHWGVITREMAGWIKEGTDRSVERHVIARRASETELVLLAMMTGRHE